MAGVGKVGEVKYGNVLRNSRGGVGNIFEELKESEIELDISNDLEDNNEYDYIDKKNTKLALIKIDNKINIKIQKMYESRDSQINKNKSVKLLGKKRSNTNVCITPQN